MKPAWKTTLQKKDSSPFSMRMAGTDQEAKNPALLRTAQSAAAKQFAESYVPLCRLQRGEWSLHSKTQSGSHLAVVCSALYACRHFQGPNLREVACGIDAIPGVF